MNYDLNLYFNNLHSFFPDLSVSKVLENLTSKLDFSISRREFLIFLCNLKSITMLIVVRKITTFTLALF